MTMIKTMRIALLLAFAWTLNAQPALSQTQPAQQTFSAYVHGLPAINSLAGSENIFALQAGAPKTTTPYQILSIIAGDCSSVSPPSVVCTKTNGVSFAPSATTDTTNATNITLGTLANGRYAAVNLAAGNVNGGVTNQLPLANGGCGGTSAATCFTNAAPIPVRAGDIIYWNGSAWVTLAGNNSGTQYLQETTAGVPSWGSSTFAVAAKADQIAGTSTTLAVTPAEQQFHPSAAKAYVSYQNNATNGAQTLNASYNVSGVSRTGVGTVTITFSTAFTSANYVCVGNAQGSASTNAWAQITNGSKTTTNVGFSTLNAATTAVDNGADVVCFGTQ
jgi:hypothetical protein